MENRFDKFKADAEKLLATAEAMHTDELVKDVAGDPEISINPEAWERYRTILSGIIAAKENLDGVLDVKYQKSPSMEDDFASVTVKLDKACTLHSDARTALALAAALADMVTMTTNGNKMWVGFTVSGIWEEGNNDAH